MNTITAPENYHHGDLRNALMQAALVALEQDGPSALSLRKLAKSVAVSPTAVYRHFENKDALMAAIACEGFLGLIAEMQQRLNNAPAADPLQRLSILGEGYLAYAMNHSAHYRLMFGKRMIERNLFPELRNAAERSYNMLRQAVSEAQQAGQLPNAPVEIQTTMAWSLVHGFSTLHNDRLLNSAQLPPADNLGKLLIAMAANNLPESNTGESS